MTALFLTLSAGKLYLALLAIVLASTLVEIACAERRFARSIRVPLFYFNILLTILFIGLRWEVGTDWESYKGLFDDLEFNSDFLLNVYHFDPGYVVLNAIVKFIFNNYSFFLLICAVLALGLTAKLIIRESPFYNFSLFIFISSYLPIHFFGSTRRGIAIAAATLFLVAFRKTQLRSRWKWFLTAFLFHRTAFILLIAVPVRRWRLSKGAVALILAIALVIGIGQLAILIIQAASSHLLGFGDVQIVDQLIYYGETFNEHTPDGVNPVSAGLISFLRKIILFAFFLKAMNKTVEKTDGDFLYEHLLKIYVVGIAIYAAFIGAPIFQIIGVYFLYLEVLLIPICFNRLRGSTRYIFLLYVVAVNIAQYVAALNVLPDVFIPYKSILY